MIEVVFGLVAEVIVYIFLEILFRQIILPMLKFIGTSVRWIVRGGKDTFAEIWKKEDSTGMGLIVVVLIVATLVMTVVQINS